MNTAMHIIAVLVLAFVAMRLAALPSSGRSAGCRLTWHLWVLGQVGIGAGALAMLCGWWQLAAMFMLTGQALQYGVRIKRRSTDR